MAKEMQIVGKCSFCQREVGPDLRPINQMNMEYIEFIANKLKECQPSTTKVETKNASEQTEPSVPAVPVPVPVPDNSSEKKIDPVAILTDAMLNMVKEQFETVPVSETDVPEDNAELIMAMLTEEQHIYNQYLQKTSVQVKSRKR